jgi:hypothetical protein
MIRVIGQRFELNDSAVFIIAELEEQLERGVEEDLTKSKKAIENPKEVSGAEKEETGESEEKEETGESEEKEEQEEEQGEEGEEEGEREESGAENKAVPAKSPLSVIAEESKGMMKSFFSSSKSGEEEEKEEKEDE